MKNLFSKCLTFRRSRFRKHKLTPKIASNHGAFDCGNNPVYGESYRRKTELHEPSHFENASQPTESFTEVIQDTCKEDTFNNGKYCIHNTDNILAETTKEITNDTKTKITTLLNCLYADEFVEDAFLLEILIILFTSDKCFEGNNSDVIDDEESTYEVQEWIDIMSEKIYGREAKQLLVCKVKYRVRWEDPSLVARRCVNGFETLINAY